METIRDIVEAGQGVVQVDHNRELDTPLSEVSHFLYNAHARPLFDDENLMPLPSLPDSMPALQGFFATELGKKVLAYSYRRADTGSTEIGRQMLTEFDSKGEGALMLSSSVIGRGVLDANRPTARALDFHVPGVVGRELMQVHGIVLGLLDQVFERLKPHLKSVFQPHTMASGSLDAEEGERFEALTAQIKANVQEGSYADEALVRANLEELSALYDRMNNRRDRPNIDVLERIIVAGQHGPIKKPDGKFKLEHLADRGSTSLALAEALSATNLPLAFDEPFPHMPGYPGSELARKAAAAGIKQGTLDVPRYLLQRHDFTTVDTLTFRPDHGRVCEIAGVAVNALTL